MDTIDKIFSQKSTDAKKQRDKDKPKRATPQPRETFSVRGSARKDGSTHTEDGLKIYSAEELRIGKGQNTPLCPFDCECCF